MAASASIRDRLVALGAHHDLSEWAARYGDDWATFYRECPRADWLLALAARLGAAHTAIVRAAVGCTRFATAYLLDEGAELEGALQAAESWAEGHADERKCAQQQAQLDALPPSTDPVVDAVRQAASAALEAVIRPEAASYAASCATSAAVLAAGDCAMDSALRFGQERCAELVRRVVPVEVLVALSQA
jgi:hypothetical protein